MTEQSFQRKHDNYIACKLIELGKSPKCWCTIFVEHRFEKPPIVALDYNYKCPVHYPDTAAVLRISNG